ncbi:MAG: DUF2071 domain-containing protein [Bacteroidia bacterium]|nr:DUF2071 domain-containing protein [Bacteroidia bacterium]
MKRLTQATGILEDMVLLNFRTDAEVLRRLLPQPFEPRLVDGFGLVGILLFRMRDLECETTMGLPSPPSEHVLYRIAVSWQQGARTHHGMYILRHEVNAKLPIQQRRRGLFPVAGRPVRWIRRPWAGSFEWTIKTKNRLRLKVGGKFSKKFPGESVFESLDNASDFFARERSVVAPRYQKSIFTSTHFLPLHWSIKPLHIHTLQTDFSQLENLFPKGMIFFDSGLIWPQMPCRWQKGHEILASRPFIDDLLSASRPSAVPE